MTLPRRSPKRSLNQLRELRFHRYDICSAVVRDWFSLRAKIDRHSLDRELWRVQVSPLTLQALDYTGLAKHLVFVLRKLDTLAMVIIWKHWTAF